MWDFYNSLLGKEDGIVDEGNTESSLRYENCDTGRQPEQAGIVKW